MRRESLEDIKEENASATPENSERLSFEHSAYLIMLCECAFATCIEMCDPILSLASFSFSG